MFIPIAQQTTVFLMAIILGIFIAVIYDIFRCLRYGLKSGIISTFILDIVFVLITIVVVFLFLVTRALGEVRAYMFVGSILGAYLYFITISEFFIKLLGILFRFVKNVFLTIYSLGHKFLGLFNCIFHRFKFISYKNGKGGGSE